MKHGLAALPVALVATAIGLTAAPAWAQYKVVQPDGRVTYTDRPPADQASRVTPVGSAKAGPASARPGAAAASPELSALAATLPLELRNAVQRYPVTLLSAPDCTPCDNGRRLLQQRGVPHQERRVANDDDVQALEQQLATKTVPVLLIGTQPLRGFVETDWNNFLDAAGYPKESRLPKGWKAPAVANLAPKGSAPAAAAGPQPARTALPPREGVAPTEPVPGRIRF